MSTQATPNSPQALGTHLNSKADRWFKMCTVCKEKLPINHPNVKEWEIEHMKVIGHSIVEVGQ